jgi:hypothetical protein
MSSSMANRKVFGTKTFAPAEREGRRSRQQESLGGIIASEPGVRYGNQERRSDGQDRAGVDPNDDPGAMGAYSSGVLQACKGIWRVESEVRYPLLAAPERWG